MTVELRTPREWEQDERYTTVVVDPDGWRFDQRENGVVVYPARSFDDPITREEYEARCGPSTIIDKHSAWWLNKP
jgi:hypothetical protein